MPLCNDDSVLQQQQEQLEQDIDFIMSMVMMMRSPLYMLALLILCNMPGYMYVRYLCKCLLQCTHTACVCECVCSVCFHFILSLSILDTLDWPFECSTSCGSLLWDLEFMFELNEL